MTDQSNTRSDLPALLSGGVSTWSLDPAASSVEFHIKHFWGLMTVRGHFDELAGEGSVGADGTVSGEIRIATGSVNTKNKKRDQHLRSDHFFDAEHHPAIVVSASGLVAADGQDLRGPMTLDIVGHVENLDAVVHVVEATADAVTLHVDSSVDRTAFGISWGPLGMTSSQARALATARFVRT